MDECLSDPEVEEALEELATPGELEDIESGDFVAAGSERVRVIIYKCQSENAFTNRLWGICMRAGAGIELGYSTRSCGTRQYRKHVGYCLF